MTNPPTTTGAPPLADFAALLERERAFREDFSNRLTRDLRQYLDASLERERLFREDFSGPLMAELRSYIDTRLQAAMATQLPLALPHGAHIFMHTRDGHRVLLDPSEPFITFHTLEHGEWEYPLRQVLRQLLKPGDCFLDVGANIGLHALLAAALVGPSGHVLALEPHPVTAALLHRNMEINGLLDRVTIIEAAAAEQDGGTRRFEYFAEHSAMSGFTLSLPQVAAFRGSAQALEVPVVTLDALLARTGRKPDVIKIDVEGFELIVLRGSAGILADTHDTAFVLEHNPQVTDGVMGAGSAEAVLTTLLEAGFEGQLISAESCLPLGPSALRQAAGDLLFLRQGSPRLERIRCMGLTPVA